MGRYTIAGLPLSNTFGDKLPPTCDNDLGAKWDREQGRLRKILRRMVERECVELELIH